MLGLRSWVIALAAVGSIGCANGLQSLWPNHEEEPPEAASKIAPQTPATGPVVRESEEDSQQEAGLRIGPRNTAISFIGANLITKHTGSFERFEGRIQIDSDDPRDARLSFTIDMDSISTNIFLLTNHLKRADFLDVEHYPEATFVSSKVMQVPGGGVNHIITGEMTIHGVTRTLEIPARLAITAKLVSLDATIDLHQSEFGMEEAAKKTDDVVRVSVSCRIRRH